MNIPQQLRDQILSLVSNQKGLSSTKSNLEKNKSHNYIDYGDSSSASSIYQLCGLDIDESVTNSEHILLPDAQVVPVVDGIRYDPLITSSSQWLLFLHQSIVPLTFVTLNVKLGGEQSFIAYCICSCFNVKNHGKFVSFGSPIWPTEALELVNINCSSLGTLDGDDGFGFGDKDKENLPLSITRFIFDLGELKDEEDSYTNIDPQKFALF